MAREVLKIITEPVEYVPLIDGNRDDPDPFRVWLTPMTAAEMGAAERSMGQFSGGKVNFTERAQRQLRTILCEHITRVYGYTIPHKDSGARLAPINGTELYDAIWVHGDDHEASILGDIYNALRDQSHLREGLWERLRSQPGSRAPATPLSGGAASGADGATPPEILEAKTSSGSTAAATMPNATVSYSTGHPS